MEEIKVKDIIEITKGKLLVGDLEETCENYAKDTREVKKGDIYVGIKGEKVNGGIYYEKAFENGAKGCIVQEVEIEEEQKEKYKDKIIIKVEDTIKALQQIASFKRNKYNIPVIAITGSVGKTSTKDIIASVVSQKYNTLKTMGNYNNHIGVPLTILNLKEHEALVIEMGMNHLKEISILTQIAKPTIAVITNIGTAHIGNLGSRENILKAKLEILEGLQEDGAIIINNDNDLLHKWQQESKEKNIQTYGIENESNYMAEEIIANEDGSKYTLKGKNTKIEVPVGGNHFVLNSLCAIAVGERLNIEIEEIKEGIKNFELTKKRMDISTVNGMTIINDSYNANYDSVKAAIEYLAGRIEKRKIAVLGDMLELGKFSKQLHEKVGEELIKNKIDIIITVGKEAENIVKITQKNNIKTVQCKTNDEAIEKMRTIIKQGDCILVKASNSMHFDEIVKAIH